VSRKGGGRMTCTIDEETRAWIKANCGDLWGTKTEAAWYGSPPGKGCYLSIDEDFSHIAVVYDTKDGHTSLIFSGEITVETLLFMGKAFGIEWPNRDYKGQPNDE